MAEGDSIPMTERKTNPLDEEKHEVDLTTGSIKTHDSSILRRKISCLILLALATAYFIASLIITPLSPWGRVAIYCFILLKVFFEFVPVELITTPIAKIWKPIGSGIGRIPGLVKGGIAAFVIIMFALIITFAIEESKLGTKAQRCQSLLGVAVFLSVMAATSRRFRRINWHTVASGVLLQLLVGLFVMKTEVGSNAFTYLSKMASNLLEFSKIGAVFVFGEGIRTSFAFAALVLPAVLFFASLVQILYYLGAMQWVITKSAFFFKFVMDTTVCESIVAAASPFVGMGESALLVKPFLVDMTRSELHQVMASGFATISGAVLIAFINIDVDPKILITSCIMSIPCSLALSKIRYPEEEESKTANIVAHDGEERESNVLHAAANGAAQGVTLCLLIAGSLLAVTSLIALANAILGLLAFYLGYTQLTLEFIGSYLFWPFAWLVGVPYKDCLKVGELLAIKLFANEFIAYHKLKSFPVPSEITERSAILATYALCGFANFASIGIQVGCLGAMAPTRKRDLAELAMSSMITGTICTFVSAAFAGLLI